MAVNIIISSGDFFNGCKLYSLIRINFYPFFIFAAVVCSKAKWLFSANKVIKSFFLIVSNFI